MDKMLIVEGVRRLNDRGEPIKEALDIGRDVQQLERLRREHPDLSLVILDPLDSLIGRLDTKSGNEVRNALWPLRDWCESTGITAL